MHGVRAVTALWVRGRVAGQTTSMRALTVLPGTRDSLELSDLAEPDVVDGPLLVESLAVGLCGTDAEIVQAEYGEAPPGERAAGAGSREPRPGAARPPTAAT